jgi:hypothetical protein
MNSLKIKPTSHLQIDMNCVLPTHNKKTGNARLVILWWVKLWTLWKIAATVNTMVTLIHVWCSFSKAWPRKNHIHCLARVPYQKQHHRRGPLWGSKKPKQHLIDKTCNGTLFCTNMVLADPYSGFELFWFQQVRTKLGRAH